MGANPESPVRHHDDVANAEVPQVITYMDGPHVHQQSTEGSSTPLGRYAYVVVTNEQSDSVAGQPIRSE